MADLLPEYGQKAIDQLREKVYYLKIQIRVLTLLLILVLGYLGINEYKHLYQCSDSWIYLDALNQENFNLIKSSTNSSSQEDFIKHLSTIESNKVIELVRKYDGFCEKISTTKQLMENQFLADHSMQISVMSPTYGEIKQSVHPAIIDNKHLQTSKAAPQLGEDTDTVLRELGYLETDIIKLRNGRVIL